MSDLNDPRACFAAERTLLAWTRTGITLMGFGFVIERFGLFLYMFMSVEGKEWQRDSFWVGICFILLGRHCGSDVGHAVPERVKNLEARRIS